MSVDGEDKSPAWSLSPRTAPPASSNTPNSRPFTPCRTVGLKRKSTGSPSLHANVSKRTNVAGETKKRIGFDGGKAVTATATGDDEPYANSDDEAARKRVANKRREIAALKSELKNSEQHNLNQIQELSNKWLNVCQEALTALFNKSNKNQNFTLLTMEDLITHLGINPDLIHFDSNTQEFY